jgi:uncharacterized membrane-anchored protein
MKCIGAQGELRIYRVLSLPTDIGNRRPQQNSQGAYILAHSEKGHHHVLGGAVDVIEHTEVQKIGTQSLAMRTLYAIVKEPTVLRQTAFDSHQDILLDEGLYAIRADVEYDPFADQIAEVRD